MQKYIFDKINLFNLVEKIFSQILHFKLFFPGDSISKSKTIVAKYLSQQLTRPIRISFFPIPIFFHHENNRFSSCFSVIASLEIKIMTSRNFFLSNLHCKWLQMILSQDKNLFKLTWQAFAPNSRRACNELLM